MKHIIRVTSTIVAILFVMIMAGCAASGNQTGTKPQVTQISPTVKPIATEQPTEPPTEPPTTDPIVEKTAKLRSGYWCYYNGSNYMSAYTFSDEKLNDGKYVGHLIAYDVIDKTVKMMDAQDNNQMTNYEITEKAVLVTGEGGLVQTMTFSDDMSALIETVDGKERRYVHFNTIPNYNQLKSIAPTTAVDDKQDSNNSKTSSNTQKETEMVSQVILSENEYQNKLVNSEYHFQYAETSDGRKDTNYYGSIVAQTGLHLIFFDDYTFDCVMGQTSCKGSYSINTGLVTVHIDEAYGPRGIDPSNYDILLLWDYYENTIIFEYKDVKNHFKG